HATPTRSLLRVFCRRWQGVRHLTRSDGLGSRVVSQRLGRGRSLPRHIAPVEPVVATQPNSAVSTSAHVNQVLELLRKLMEYRSSACAIGWKKSDAPLPCCTRTFCYSSITLLESAREISWRSGLMLEGPRSRSVWRA